MFRNPYQRQYVIALNPITEAQSAEINLRKIFVDLIKRNLWRFVMDGRHHQYNDPYFFDKPRPNHLGELGYLQAMANAMYLMLATLHRPLSISLLNDLHELAISNVTFHDQNGSVITPATDMRSNKVTIEYVLENNITYLGLLELMLYDCELAVLGSAKSAKICHQMDVYEDLKKKSTQYYRYDFFKGEALTEHITVSLKKLIDNYENEIQQSKTILDKIIAIAKFVRKASILHPYEDANTRTFVFLIANKLLIQNDLPPAIFEDPNRFDGFSVPELCFEIVKGIECALRLSSTTLKIDINFQLLKEQLEKYYLTAVNNAQIKAEKSQFNVITLDNYTNSITKTTSSCFFKTALPISKHSNVELLNTMPTIRRYRIYTR